MIKSGANFNPNNTSPNQNINVNGGNASNTYISELQNAIDNEMKKMSTRGKIRTFLSASDRIDTVKYNMEYI